MFSARGGAWGNHPASQASAGGQAHPRPGDPPQAENIPNGQAARLRDAGQLETQQDLDGEGLARRVLETTLRKK